MSVCLPCEGIGSVPRPASLQAALSSTGADVAGETKAALLDTLNQLTASSPGLPITDGEQSKPSFATYSIAGITTLKPDGVRIDFADGHHRQLPVISEGPFVYSNFAVEYLREAKALAPAGSRLKQAVISASAMSLLYPSRGIEGYTRDAFVEDVVANAVKDIRLCLDAGADSVQVDFTEARLSLKLDPSGGLYSQLLAVNERVFAAFSEDENARIGIHVCPGADADSVHSAEIDYSRLIPQLLGTLSCRRFYFQMKSEADPDRALAAIRDNIKPGQVIFVGAIDVNSARVETAEEVSAFVENAAKFIPCSQLGVCDDCGFSPFADDVSTSRDIAFAKIAARVQGTKLASAKLLA